MIALTPWHFEDHLKASGDPEHVAHYAHLIFLLCDTTGSQYGDGYHL